MTRPTTTDAAPAAYPITRIRPPAPGIDLQLRELLRYWDLIFLLIWREIKIRYKQTLVGSAWALLQPIITMVIFTLLFSRVMEVPSGNAPYPVFALAALVPWTYFTHALTKTSRCLIDNRLLLEKVYFPRLIYPLAATLGGLLDFAIAFLILVAMMVYYSIVPTVAVLLLPVFMLLNIITALSIGLWLSAINVQYRDFMNILPFLVQILLFVTPVAYSASMIPEEWHLMYGLNPMAGVVEGFRWALLGEADPPVPLILVSAGVAILLFVSGLVFFKKREDTFVDVI